MNLHLVRKHTAHKKSIGNLTEEQIVARAAQRAIKHGRNDFECRGELYIIKDGKHFPWWKQ